MTRKQETAEYQSQRALEFLRTVRGRYIISQALWYAIQTLENVDPPHKEESNIADMRFFQENLFPMFAAIKEAEIKHAVGGF